MGEKTHTVNMFLWVCRSLSTQSQVLLTSSQSTVKGTERRAGRKWIKGRLLSGWPGAVRLWALSWGFDLAISHPSENSFVLCTQLQPDTFLCPHYY